MVIHEYLERRTSDPNNRRGRDHMVVFWVALRYFSRHRAQRPLHEAHGKPVVAAAACPGAVTVGADGHLRLRIQRHDPAISKTDLSMPRRTTAQYIAHLDFGTTHNVL